MYKRIILGVLLSLAMLVLMTIEFKWLGKYLDLKQFIKTWSFAGFAFGLVGGWWWSRKSKSETLDKVRTMVALVVVAGIVLPLAVSAVNRLGAAGRVLHEQVLLEAEDGRIDGRSAGAKNAQASQYLLFFYRDNRLYMVRDGRAHFAQNHPGDSITVPIARGLLGYDFVVWPKN